GAVPGCAHRGYPARAAVREQLAELIVRGLELDQQRGDVLQPLRAVAGLIDDRLAVRFTELPLLELDGVRAGRDRGIDELLRNSEVAVVVDADPGDHIARLAGTDPAAANLEGPLSHSHASI